MYNPATFDLNLLKVFDALLREGSVSGAAIKVGLSQPAVSNALQRLRTVLGDPLFVRTRHGMEPTAFALSLSDPVLDGLSRIRSGLSQVSSFDPASEERTFVVLMNDVGAATFLPAVVKALSTAAPAVDLRVSEIDHADYEDALDSGQADLAVGRVMLSKTFRSDFLMESPFVAILDPDHPGLEKRRGRPTMTRETYLASRHVTVTPRGATVSPIVSSLGPRGMDARVVLDVPHATSLFNILPGTDLIATVPDRCIDFLCQDRRLTWIVPPIEFETNLIYQWWHRLHEHDAGHRWFRDFMQTTIRTAPPLFTS